MTAREIINLIWQSRDLTEEDLISINKSCISKIKTVRNMKGASVKSQLSVGLAVRWQGKLGPATGIVKEIKQKFAHVRADGTGMVWRIPMNMLTPEV